MFFSTTSFSWIFTAMDIQSDPETNPIDVRDRNHTTSIKDKVCESFLFTPRGINRRDQHRFCGSIFHLVYMQASYCYWKHCVVFVAQMCPVCCAVYSSCSCVVLVYLCVLSVCWFRCGPYIQRSPTVSSNARRRDALSELPCRTLKMMKSLVRESKGCRTHLQCLVYTV